MATTTNYDVAIVGGGIAGLYFAWRLRHSHLSVIIFECSDRLGGRIYTHVTPGGFPADMGAMRFDPCSHHIVNHLIKIFKLPTIPFLQRGNDEPYTDKYFIRNKHFDSRDDMVKLFSDKPEEQHYVHQRDFTTLMQDLPKNSTWSDSMMKNGTRGDAMTMSGVFAEAALKNPELFNAQSPLFTGAATVGEVTAIRTGSQGKTFYTLRNGMTALVEALRADLDNADNKTIRIGSRVHMISEKSDGRITLQVSSSTQIYQTHKLVLACNARGVQLISWNSPYPRSGILQEMLSKTCPHAPMKMYMTYDEAWWEKCGLAPPGSVTTDLPLGQMTILGEHAKIGSYATLLASYTFKCLDVFEGLNLPENERFHPTVGEVPADLLPSDKLVKFIQKQLKLVTGSDKIPEPVSAACKIWTTDPINAANHFYKVGVPSKDLQWKCLRPFSDTQIYMTGDTFPVMSETGSLSGWMETSLVTSERILVKYFNFSPIVEHLPLEK